MKPVIFLVFVFGIACVSLCGICWAHVPAGVTYPIFQWPEGFEPVIDGNLDEWDIVPDQYILSYDSSLWIDQLGYYIRAKEDFESGDLGIVRVIAGWSEAENRLYFAAEILDDVHQIDRPPRDSLDVLAGPGFGIFSEMGKDDSFGIFLDADHSGGRYTFWRGLEEEERNRLYNAHAQAYMVSVPPPDEYPLLNWNMGIWSWRAPWAEVHWHIEGVFRGPNVTFYEISIVPFDDLHWVGPDSSKVHDLTEGEIAGLGYMVLDYDLGSAARHWYMLSTTDQAVVTADYFPDFRLEPVEEAIFQATSVGNSTWGEIKASFQHFNTQQRR